MTYNEKNEVVKNFISEKMSVDRAMFNIGIKDISEKENLSLKIAAIKIIMDIICGESSHLYEELYEKRIIDKSFAYAYTCGRDYGFITISGFSDKPEIIKELFIDKVKSIKKSGIDNNLFNIIKNKYIGRFIRGFNSIDGIVSAQVDFFTKGINLYDYSSALKNVNTGDAENILYEMFSENNIVMSLIAP